MRHVLAVLISGLTATTSFAQVQPPWIFAMHDPGAENEIENKGKRGWIVFTEAVGSNPDDRSGRNYRVYSDAGHGVIVRLNNGYGSSGTIPHEADYAMFAQRVANFIEHSPGADIWILGNETNLAREWPGNRNADPSSGEAITPQRYVRCYNLVWNELQRRGLTGEILVPAPTGTWGPPLDGSLASFPNRGVPGFIDYWVQVLDALGSQKIGGLAIHTYTHGGNGKSPIDPNLIFSEQKMNPPYQDIYFHFRAYKNFMAAVPTNLQSLPLWVTESSEGREILGYNWDPHPNTSRWIQNAYAEVNSWNATPGNQKIRALALFRWPDVWEGDRNSCVSCVGSAVDGFRRVLDQDYRWNNNGGEPPPPASRENDADVGRTESTLPNTVPQSPPSAVSIRVRNSGKTTWKKSLGYRLGAASANQFQFEGFACGGYQSSSTDARVYLCEDVLPNQWAEFRFQLRAPAGAPDRWRLSVRMVRDGFEWFGDVETWDLPVSEPPPPTSQCLTGDFPIPDDRWKLEIWNNRRFEGEPVERRSDFPGSGGFEKDWGLSPVSGCTNSDDFAIRFTRRFHLSTAGAYRFTAKADDGVRVYLDGDQESVIDAWRDQPPTQYSGTRSLAAGWHELRMDFYENAGGAFTKIAWELEDEIPPPPPSTRLLQNADFSRDLDGWTRWTERGALRAEVVGGRLELSGELNGGVFQTFDTGGAGARINVSGFWSAEASGASSRWAEVLIINGSRVPINGQDENAGKTDVILLYKKNGPAGWGGPFSAASPVFFQASSDRATLILKTGSWQGATRTQFDDIVVERR